MNRLEFPVKTGKITINLDSCDSCLTLACVKACSLFGTGIYRAESSRPALVFSLEETARRCNECLGCEQFCLQYGNGAVRIELDMFGLNSLREEHDGHPG